MGVVDSSLEGGLLIIKTMINMESEDERTVNIGQSITEKSLWVVEKAATLLNFNKAFLSAQNFSDILIQDSILDPRNFLINSQKDLYHIPKTLQNTLDLDSDELSVVQKCMKKQGLSVIEGTYLSGKSTAAVALIQSLLGTS